jgi:hypothetical protein
MTVAKELSKYSYNLDLVGVQEARLDRSGREPAGIIYIFFYEGLRIMN